MRTSLILAIVLAMPVTLPAAEYKDNLPAGAKAFVFGNGSVDGFTAVPASAACEGRDFGFTATDGLSAGGGKWPDRLTGSYVMRADGKDFTFQTKVPNGDYLVWLSAGKVIKPDGLRHFLLQVGENKLLDETPDDVAISGVNYLGRFFLTACPAKAESLWSSYVNVMYPGQTTTAKVADGVLSVKLANHFLSALVVVPADRKAEFEKMTAAIAEKRMVEFTPTVRASPATAKSVSETDYVIWTPADAEAMGPTAVPGEAERKPVQIAAAGAPGQRVIIHLAVLPQKDLGKCTLKLADLVGPDGAVLPAGAFQGFFENYFGSGRGGAVLSPTLTLAMDQGITRPLWLWLKVPADAKGGLYKGTFTFQPAAGKPAEIPVTFEVYPFHLDDNIPMSCGYWGGVGPFPKWLSAETRRKTLAARLAWMRDVGLTAVTMDPVSFRGLNPDGTVKLEFDDTLLKAAKAAGMGRNPHQAMMMGNWMASIGRPIARNLPESSGVFDNPGVEFKAPKFRGYCLDAARQFKKFLDAVGVPLVVTAVNEPRETEINSWNRNFDDTVEYLKILREVGLVASVDPMADRNGATNKDYVPFVDYCDVVNPHAWNLAANMIRTTVARKKTLWLYNVGVDRYSWGFYNWRAASEGRWEWQLYEGNNPGSIAGYPNREPYNPLAGYVGGLTQEAPLDACPGGFACHPRFMFGGQGVTDFTYCYTLEQALKARYDGDKARVAAEAREFLHAIRAAMPEFPQVKGLASAADSAKVGLGITDTARLQCSAWQARIAQFLKDLGYKAPGDPPPAKIDETPARRRAMLVEGIIKGTQLYQAAQAEKDKKDLAAYKTALPATECDALLKTYQAILAAPPEQLVKWIAGDDSAFDTKAATALAEANVELDAALPVNLAARYIAYRVGAYEPAAVRSIASLYQMVLETGRDGDALQNLLHIYRACGLPIYLGELGIDWGDDQFLAMGKELSPPCAPSPVGTGPAEWQIAGRKLQNWGEKFTGKITAATYAREVLQWPAVAECAAAIRAMPAQKICIIGHSYTMSLHWSSQGSFTDIAAEMIKSLNPRVQFVSFQGGGLTPARALGDFADKAIAEKPDKVLLVLSVRNEPSSADLKTVIGKLTAAGAKVYFFDSLRAGGPTNIVTFDAGTLDAARGAGATIVQVGKILSLHPLRGDFVALDGIHMNPPYHKVMAAEWVKFLAGKRTAELGDIVDPSAEPRVDSVVGTEIPRIDQLPSLKDAADWTTCARGLCEIDNGTIEISKGNTRIAQRVFLGRTDKDLYVLMFNCEPDTAGMTTTFKDPAADRDKAIFSDDDAEMFVAPKPGTLDHYQFILNSVGCLWDGRNKSEVWNSNATTFARVIPSKVAEPGAWIVELVVPLAAFGGAPAAGTAWNFNFTRIRHAPNIKDWKFSWAVMPDASFHHPDKFKPVTFK